MTEDFNMECDGTTSLWLGVIAETPQGPRIILQGHPWPAEQSGRAPSESCVVPQHPTSSAPPQSFAIATTTSWADFTTPPGFSRVITKAAGLRTASLESIGITTLS